VPLPFGWRPHSPFTKHDPASPSKAAAPIVVIPVTTTPVVKESKVSIFSDVEAVLTKIAGKAPAVISVASLTISSLSVAIESILDVTGQEAEASGIAGVVAIVQAGLSAVSATIGAAGATPTVSSALNALLANLQGLLTAGQIKNPATLTEVTALVNIVVGEIKSVIAVL
jgi:hypothetical protein